MLHPHGWLPLAAASLLLAAAHGPAQANDSMFPPAPAAKASIDFDGHGFLIHGRRTFLVSGSLHFARLPRAQWRDMLLKFKRAGYNTVQTYVFWNWQEPKEGEWDFSGDHDLDGFLKLVGQMGMYATVRVGPYCCAEWDSGGYPVWLRFKPDMAVRRDNPQFMAEAGEWYAKILPIVAANQINRGGPVILLQMENEHGEAWGTDMPNSYFRKLHDIVMGAGIQIPWFFSGLHHGSDPAGDHPWDNAGRTSPWYSTEFWAGWIGRHGPPDAGQLRAIERGDWKIQAYGGNGYNHYMLYGGTNFGTYNNDEDAASYDYGAAISQGGGLRTLYYRDKRAALFATSFPEILEDSRDATAQYAKAATGAGVRVTARQGLAGTILYLDNPGDQPVTTRVRDASGGVFPAAGPLTLAPGEIMPVVMDYALTPDVQLTLGAACILGIARQGDTITLVTYGEPGSHGQMIFHLLRAGREISQALTFPKDSPVTSEISDGDTKFRTLQVSTTLADRTWFVDAGGTTSIVVGPEYVGDAAMQGGRLTMSVESADRPVLADPLGGQVWVYSPGPDPQHTAIETTRTGTTYTPLNNWQMRPGDAEATPRYDDSSWKASPDPLQMGADGDYGAYAWYRAALNAPAAGDYTLRFADAGDWLRVFVDGRPIGPGDVRVRGGSPVVRRIPIALMPGEHSLAVLTAHYGRDKLFNYYGPIDDVYAKGLNGPVTLESGADTAAGRPIAHWRIRMVSRDEADAARMAAPTLDTGGGGWQDAAVGQDVFVNKPGFAWFRADLGSDSAPHHTLHFESVDDNGTVYLNGRRLMRHEGYGDPFDVSLDSAWNPNGANALAVLVENTDGPGGITGPVTLNTGTTASGTTIQNWRMRGGVTGWEGADWRPLSSSAPGRPTWYRATFTYHVASTGSHPVLRATFGGLSRGFFYLNGRNLGRYPEKSPATSLYLPDSYLKDGTNTLAIFDEEGQLPTRVALVPDEEASYTTTTLTLDAR
ncbi:MAG: beta-galactosidase [Armatimonadetes bacterium]|nr:beta-galactosidase [Armatimonadota bacterium]